MTLLQPSVARPRWGVRHVVHEAREHYLHPILGPDSRENFWPENGLRFHFDRSRQGHGARPQVQGRGFCFVKTWYWLMAGPLTRSKELNSISCDFLICPLLWQLFYLLSSLCQAFFSVGNIKTNFSIETGPGREKPHRAPPSSHCCCISFLLPGVP